MEPIDAFGLVKSLEKDLARFYRKLRNITQLKELSDVFQAMEQQSSAHADRIDDQCKVMANTPLDVESIYGLHNKIKSSLFEKLSHEKDIHVALAQLAEAEELIGKLYASISKYYRKSAQIDASTADQFDNLAREEFQHRDFILKKLEKIRITLGD
ncbi:MAG: hypothetical protein ABIK68_06570 [bacterium]